MNREFEECLERKKIVAFAKGTGLAAKELKAATSDLSDAKAGYEDGRYKWSTIQGYYPMFHVARALVYSRGYREKSHYCLAVALRALFVDEGKLDARIVREFVAAMSLREAADYETEFSEAGAKAVITSAEKFIQIATDVLTRAEQSASDD